MSPGRVLALAAVLAFMATAGCIFYLHPQCTDDIRNGHETDVDCGGTCPKKCGLGLGCDSAADCKSGNCASGMCVPLPCFNGVRDGAETDVDCGGGTCRKCAGGRHCASGADCFSGTCDPGTSTCSSLRTVSFDAPVSYPARFKTYVIFAGDLNRDGLVDIVVANEQDSSISAFLGNGDGTFRHAGDLATGAYPTGGALADMNGDGIPDVLTANWHGNSVSVLLGKGDGTFQPAVTYPSDLQTQNLAVGDLNGDGHPDVITANLAGASMSLFLGRADGTLEPAVNIPVGEPGSSAAYTIALADFDGDGKLDLAVADVGQPNRIVVRLGRGDGTFGPEVSYPGVSGWLTVYDVNLDGKLDLVVAEGGDQIGVLLGNGDGTFQDQVVSTVGAGTHPFSLAFGDFNQDGVPDVVVANFGTGTKEAPTTPMMSLLLGIGDGRFEAPLAVGPLMVDTYGVVVADFDRDGKLDFATCNAGFDDMKVSINTSH